MKALNPSVCAGLLTLVSACSFHPTTVVVEPAGPASLTSSKAAHEGYLVVYSAWSSLGDSVAHRSRYTLRADDGKFSKEVVNHVDTFDEGPVRVSLAPGAYHLTARAERYGSVLVPVIIHEGKTTYVHLDGAPHNDTVLTEGSDVIKLPDGQIVGWSATRNNLTAN